MDLPSIANAKAKRVEVDLCTNDPDNGNTALAEPGRTALNVIRPNISTMGPHFVYTDAETIPTVMDVGGFKMERTQYMFDAISTDEDDGAGNRIQLDYDIAFNNIFSNVIDLDTYYITSGMTIYDEETNEVR